MATKSQSVNDAFVETMLKRASEKQAPPKPQSMHENIDMQRIEQLAESVKDLKPRPKK